MSLYQKYRPKNFSEVVGQDHIKQTLENAINYDRIGHAYLFSGPHGVGKTSIARILGRAANCIGEGQKPCNNCLNCTASLGGSDLNIIEIDAASNRGIDDIRDLREKVAFPPQGAKRKVYIIDEVHMLSKDAFNALLKTLEEPPKHSLFILATTELHKVLETIISRTQHFELKKITLEQIADHLKKVAIAEDLELDDSAARLVAANAGGSLRDSLSLLDQLKNYNKKIDLDAVRFVIGLPPEQELISLLQAYFNKDSGQMLRLAKSYADKGYNVEVTIDQLIEVLRGIIYAQNQIEHNEAVRKDLLHYPLDNILKLINNLIIAKAQLRFVTVPQIPFELALLGGSEVDNLSSAEAQVADQSTQAKVESMATSESKIKEPESNLDLPESQPEEIATESLPPAEPAVSQVQHDDQVNWNDFTNCLRDENMKLSSLLASSSFELADNTLEIKVPFKFYAERIEELESKTVIKKVFKDLTGQEVDIVTKINTNEPQPEINSTANNTQIETIKEVFADVLQ